MRFQLYYFVFYQYSDFFFINVIFDIFKHKLEEKLFCPIVNGLFNYLLITSIIYLLLNLQCKLNDKSKYYLY